MTPEIYEALRKRIRVITPEEADALMGGSRLYPDACQGPIYHFSNAGLNPEGLKRYDENYIDSMIHQMSTNNLWNVCQRFYSFLRNYPNIDQRLLAL